MINKLIMNPSVQNIIVASIYIQEKRLLKLEIGVVRIGDGTRPFNLPLP